MGGIARILNGALAPADVAFTRRTTLDRTRAQLADANSQIQALNEALVAAKSQGSGLEATLAEMHSSVLALQGRSADRLQAELAQTKRLLIQHQIASKWSTVDALERLVATPPSERTCPLCNCRAQETLFKLFISQCSFGGGVLKRHQCPKCDVIFGADKMFALNAKELSQEYEWHYMVYEEGDSTAAEVLAFHSLAPRKDGRYVNFGAGAWSKSVQVLRAEGWDVYAYEPHSSAASKADWLITSEAELAARPFDGLYSNNVLEHFRYPVEALVDMKRYLKPGALMAHATPCYEYLYEYTRFHLFFFLGRSRQLLARLAGLSIESFEVEGHYMNCVFSSAVEWPTG
ncbi:class I SAM-dependent methyltransferase [Variovorax sp. dw_308]|uniref:class I SAM-dependent methyltransferase n=1 Tax=Variovorax sp. dw_308 TaxID=2721546 RepID=UPI001C470B7B|nr:class I SAM-dependent methyltransferase [Variovorax sp. dw_308]